MTSIKRPGSLPWHHHGNQGYLKAANKEANSKASHGPRMRKAPGPACIAGALYVSRRCILRTRQIVPLEGSCKRHIRQNCQKYNQTKVSIGLETGEAVVCVVDIESRDLPDKLAASQGKPSEKDRSGAC